MFDEWGHNDTPGEAAEGGDGDRMADRGVYRKPRSRHLDRVGGGPMGREVFLWMGHPFEHPRRGHVRYAYAVLGPPRRARRMASTERSTSASVVLHEETEILIAVFPCHTVGPAKSVPSR